MRLNDRDQEVLELMYADDMESDGVFEELRNECWFQWTQLSGGEEGYPALMITWGSMSSFMMLGTYYQFLCFGKTRTAKSASTPVRET